MAEGLRRAVHNRLDLVDEITERGEPGTLLPLARAELHRLAESWRQLLRAHQPDEDGKCLTCPPGLRRRRWPCRIWLTAHTHLIGDTLPGTIRKSVTNRLAPRRGVLGRSPRATPLPPVVVHRLDARGGVPQAAEPPTITELTIPPANRPPAPPPRLETDSRRIHRAAVLGRSPRLPRRRTPRPGQ